LLRLASAAAVNGRCVNSEVILSLARHLRGDQWRRCPAGAAGAHQCPFGTRVRPEECREATVPWGDPG